MHKLSALFGSALVLGTLLIVVIGLAFALTPTRQQPRVIVPTTVSTTANQTMLILSLKMPNGTFFAQAKTFVGTTQGQIENDAYVFRDVVPGNYVLNVTTSPNYFLPSTIVKILPGANLLNLTIYKFRVFSIVESTALTINGTTPGPTIAVENATAVRFVLYDNTSLIHNIAIVRVLYNANATNVLFDSLSNTLNPGGTTNDTFIASSPGSYYYTCLIGSHARDGEYGSFVVLGTNQT